MLKDKIHSIKFNDPDAPIEIFCNGKFRDYFIRGQLIRFSGCLVLAILE